MRKISLVLVISASFIVGTLVAGNLVFAAPADSQNELLSAILQEVQALATILQGQDEILPKTLELVPVGSVDGQLIHAGSAALYFGDELCGIVRLSGSGRTMLVQFATDSLVKHGVSDCKNISDDLDLEGDVDANFKEGDILVLTFFPSEPQRWIEVFRDQTP